MCLNTPQFESTKLIAYKFYIIIQPTIEDFLVFNLLNKE